MRSSMPTFAGSLANVAWSFATLESKQFARVLWATKYAGGAPLPFPEARRAIPTVARRGRAEQRAAHQEFS
eukprot:3697309-Pyramimonas_sp.AAC.1